MIREWWDEHLCGASSGVRRSAFNLRVDGHGQTRRISRCRTGANRGVAEACVLQLHKSQALLPPRCRRFAPASNTSDTVVGGEVGRDRDVGDDRMKQGSRESGDSKFRAEMCLGPPNEALFEVQGLEVMMQIPVWNNKLLAKAWPCEINIVASAPLGKRPIKTDTSIWGPGGVSNEVDEQRSGSGIRGWRRDDSVASSLLRNEQRS